MSSLEKTLSFGPHVRLRQKEGGIAVLEVCREPVNSMDAGLWHAMLSALNKAEEEPAVRGLVITSGLKKDVFMAGNDLNELYAPITSENKYTHFWVTLTTFLTRLYVSPLVTATGARGYCPAGGTAVLLCSDIRVISDVTSCGLNEVALGIPVPGFWARLLGRVVGKGPAHDMCINGAMLPAAKCVDLGLAHVSVPCHAVASEAESRVRRALELPDAGRVATKELIRGAFARAWRDFAEEEARYGWGQLCKPAAIASLDKVFARLKKGSQAAGTGANKGSGSTVQVNGGTQVRSRM